jgi:hypothetical protein
MYFYWRASSKRMTFSAIAILSQIYIDDKVLQRSSNARPTRPTSLWR